MFFNTFFYIFFVFFSFIFCKRNFVLIWNILCIHHQKTMSFNMQMLFEQKQPCEFFFFSFFFRKIRFSTKKRVHEEKIFSLVFTLSIIKYLIEKNHIRWCKSLFFSNSFPFEFFNLGRFWMFPGMYLLEMWNIDHSHQT